MSAPPPAPAPLRSEGVRRSCPWHDNARQRQPVQHGPADLASPVHRSNSPKLRIIAQMRPLVPDGHIFELRAVRAWLETSTTEKTAAAQEAAFAHAMANGDQNARRA